MFAYVIRRLFVGVIMLLVMSLVTFLLFFAGPLDPARFACGKNCSEAQQAQTSKALGFDKSPVVQWSDFVKGVVTGRQFPDDPALRKAAPKLVTDCPTGCLGYSVVSTSTVNKEFKEAIPVSVSIAIFAFIMWIIGGVLFGVIAALFKGRLLDRGIVGIALVFFAFPTFFIGQLFLQFVAIKWRVFEVPDYMSIAEGGIGAWAYNLLLPAFTLALFYMAGYVRMTRAFVLESMGEDYLRTARAKGVRQSRVLFKHALRAALTPLVTMAGLDFASLLGGAIITETVFNFNGLGKLAVVAVNTYDLPTLVGLVILLATFVILANIVVDILYAVIDPRVRVG
ncbi:ABC transporter permease [Marmoricola endophyticus]|uniref:ABC transporter permease n=1 Tax=Marmoricola endophyticus TaxID=2040280 RepID=A0A917EZT2_9ACTN|nr:ABC transporter permease [Marmoricola endophyticus]GGF36076.1 ABC transporter permease [Marmoricola endophyticus]